MSSKGMINYYRGRLQRHAEFWVQFRELPHEERFIAFIHFFEEVKQEVEAGKCSVQDAGYALKPGCYDEDIYHPHEADMTFVQDAVEDLIIVSPIDPQEAERIWEYIVSILDVYV